MVWLLLVFVGTYDREEEFHALYSIGGFFGGVGSGPWSFSLTRTFWGIPVLDLGLVGGFRLPYQGSLHSGFLWPLRTLVPSVVIALVYVLMSFLLATYAFVSCTGSWLRAEWDRAEKARYVSLCVACWLILCYPLLEYLLSEDWYSCVIPYTGFLTAAFAVSRAELVRGGAISLRTLRQCLRLLLAGSYFLLLGHVSTFSVYVWLPALLLLWQCLGVSQSFRLYWRKLAFELSLGVVVLVRLLAVVMDVGSELRGKGVPTPLGDWWASPLRDTGSLKHFIGQFISVENSWLLRRLAPEFLPRFNLPAVGVGRLALPVSLLIFGALIVLCSRAVHERRVRAWLWTIVLLYFWQFFGMIQAAPTLARVSADYQWRDSLIVIGVLATVTSVTSLMGGSAIVPRRLKRQLPIWLVFIAVYYAITTVLVPTTIAESRTREGRKLFSPASAFGSTTRNQNWSRTFKDVAGGDLPLIVLVNSKFPVFPDGVDSKIDNWRGLTGWHQLRQVGIRSWEGFPKLRSSAYLNGDEMPSRLRWLSLELCNPGITTLLRVDKLLVSPADLGECLNQLRSLTDGAPEATVDAQSLRSAGLVVVSLRYQQMFAVTPAESRQGSSVCGVVTDPNCLQSFGQREDVVGVRPVDCAGRCLMEFDLSNHQTDQRDRRVLLLPLNAQLPLRIVEVGTGRDFSSQAIGGFVGIPYRDANGHHLRVEFKPDARIYLHALSGWSHLLLFLPWLSGCLSRRRTNRMTHRNARKSEMTTEHLEL